MKIPGERSNLYRLRSASAQVIDLARVRAERAHLVRHRRPFVSFARYYLIASLVIGIALGATIARLSAGSALTQYRDGILLAQGALAHALNEQITGNAPSSARIRIAATYRSRNGHYCRSFTIAGSQSLSGLACREHNRWQLQTLLNNAAGSAPALLLELDKNLNGAALTTAAEIALRSHDWQ
jgi:hypothetical protein